jgi:hydrogenase nickel incorporation protein HypB
MFAAADAVLLNKADLLAYFDFNLDYFRRGLAMVNPKAPLFPVSCRTGDGLQDWVDWLRAQVADAGLRAEG